MGGKKKRSLRRAEKTQKTKPAKKAKATTSGPAEKKSAPGITPPSVDDKVTGELKKMKVITPNSIASRFELRLSTARSFLRELERKGIVKFVSKSRNLRVYKPAD